MHLWWLLIPRPSFLSADETCRHENTRTDDIWRDSTARQEAASQKPTFLGGDFFFKKRPIARFHYTDPRVFEAIAKQVCVAEISGLDFVTTNLIVCDISARACVQTCVRDCAGARGCCGCVCVCARVCLCLCVCGRHNCISIIVYGVSS